MGRRGPEPGRFIAHDTKTAAPGVDLDVADFCCPLPASFVDGDHYGFSFALLSSVFHCFANHFARTFFTSRSLVQFWMRCLDVFISRATSETVALPLLNRAKAAIFFVSVRIISAFSLSLNKQWQCV